MKRLSFLFLFIFSVFFYTLRAQTNLDTVHLSPAYVTDSILLKAPYTTLEISKKSIQQEATRDIGDLLRSTPNVSGIRKGGAAIDPVVRGLKFSQLNTILNSGIKIENGCPNRMDPVASHVEAEDMEKIQIIKGPFALKYGPSFGGVINLIAETPHPYEKFEIHTNASYGFETNWNGQKEHVSIYGGNKKVYFLLSGGYRNYGNYQSGNLDGHDTTFNSSFQKYTYTTKLGVSPTKNQNILFSYYEIHGRNVLYPALPMDEKSDDTRIMSIDYSIKEISKTIKSLDVKIYQSDVNHVMDNSKRTTWSSKQMVAEVDAINTGGRAEMMLKFNKNKILTGIDVEHIYKDGIRNMTMQMMGTTSTKSTNLWKDARTTNTGLFAEYSTFFNTYELNAAIRADYNMAQSEDTLNIIKNNTAYFSDVNSEYINFSASVGITKKLNKHLCVSLAAGRGTRSPNMLERYIKLLAVGYDNYDYLGNPQLKPEINNEADLTVKYSNETFGSCYINGFYSYIQDYISAVMLPSSVIMPQTQGVLGVKQFDNVDCIALKGVEFGYTSSDRYKLGGSVVAALTYASIPEVAKQVITGNQVTGETMLKDDALPEIPPFETTVAVTYKLLKGKLTPKLSCRIVADQRHTSQASYEPYTPGFMLLNASTSYSINKYSSISAGVNNILDRSYYEHLNRKIIGSTTKLYEPGRVFFINLYLHI